MSSSEAPIPPSDLLTDVSTPETPRDLRSARIKAWLQRQRRVALLALCLIASLAGGRWIHHRYTHVSTDDARIAADMIAVSSRVAGWVAEMSVRRGDRVEAGDRIAAIDARDSKLRVEESLAHLRVVEQEAATTAVRREMIDRQTSGHVQSQRSHLTATRAALQAAEADLQFRRSEFERAELLIARDAISLSRREQLLTEFRTAEQKQLRASAEVMEAEAALIEAEASRAEIGVLTSERAGLEAKAEGLRALIGRQRLDLEDRAVRSPLAGVVDASFVKVGEYIRPGQRLVSIHDPEKIWVQANIKETAIRHLALGQQVEIRVDAYPDRVFHGSVERIGNAANSQFALLPSPNPSGNFTKIAQRLRVRISLDQQAELLRPGMMVVVDIDVRDD
jgi:membrane fusion protein (multidrug efflux system)